MAEETLGRCERCGQAAAALWTVRLGVYPDVEAERSVCTDCHDEIRRFLLGLTAEPVEHAALAPAQEIEQRQKISDTDSRPTRYAWALIHGFGYVGVAVLIFVFVTWLTSR